MHFIGMLAFSVAIPLRYGIVKTVVSLAIAMVTSGFALAIASRPHLSLTRLAVGSVVMGTGICAMHYSGMAAIQIVPMIRYEPLLVAASVAIAVGASFAALWLAFNLRSGESKSIGLARAGAAAVMGLAISGMHYTAMAAARFVPADAPDGDRVPEWALLATPGLAVGVSLSTLVVLGIALLGALLALWPSPAARRQEVAATYKARVGGELTRV
jgi:NO-binding membrane sensor protein with MHYT domain